jgi:hypothetical protein
MTTLWWVARRQAECADGTRQFGSARRPARVPRRAAALRSGNLCAPTAALGPLEPHRVTQRAEPLPRRARGDVWSPGRCFVFLEILSASSRNPRVGGAVGDRECQLSSGATGGGAGSSPLRSGLWSDQVHLETRDPSGILHQIVGGPVVLCRRSLPGTGLSRLLAERTTVPSRTEHGCRRGSGRSASVAHHGPNALAGRVQHLWDLVWRKIPVPPCPAVRP